MSSSPKHNTLLLPGVSQFEVDFVIPRLGSDLPIGIDPFLLFKSRDPNLFSLHRKIVNAFNYGIALIADNKIAEAENYLRFPEVPEIGMGHAKTSKRGSGVGAYLSRLIVESLASSPQFLERGVRHVEEMQLIAVGINRDRISDIAANIIKQDLIEYTQRQCEIWQLELTRGVPVSNIYDINSNTWYDGYFDLPISPLNKESIILVPRRIVRNFPWINYDEYRDFELKAFLKPSSKSRIALSHTDEASFLNSRIDKPSMVSISQKDYERIDRYVTQKELDASGAFPTDAYIESHEVLGTAANLKNRLQNMGSGRELAKDYQMLVLEIFNFLFNPELIDGRPEVSTVHGTERRDIIFTNDSDQSFWTYLRNEHSSILIMIETKNTHAVDSDDIAQTATYLGDRLGRFGLIVSRSGLKDGQVLKTYSVYNDSIPRKIIISLSDSEIMLLLDMKSNGNNPMRFIQQKYRDFRTGAQ